MTGFKQILNRWRSSAVLMSVVILMSQPVAAHDFFGHPTVPAPENAQKYVVFMANGQYHSVDGSIMQDGLIAGDGMFFQSQIMQRSEVQIEQNRNEAVSFFQQRFGVDVLTNDKMLFTGVYVDPRNNLRAYTVSGENAPSDGWEVRDGGWAAFVMAPEGITLGGEFDGVHIPANSVLFYGDYNIKIEREDGSEDELIFHYKSAAPFVADGFGNGIINCEISHPQYGVGLASGVVLGELLNDELLMQQNVKNVLIFPAND
ncbi:MAG: hypothetical protein ACI9FJ_001852 [Alteromonadaceae bacterium]|jgi:hypothetical protein